MSKLNNRFLYWCIGWYLMLRHPIKRPIDLARTAELLTDDDGILKTLEGMKK